MASGVEHEQSSGGFARHDERKLIEIGRFRQNPASKAQRSEAPLPIGLGGHRCRPGFWRSDAVASMMADKKSRRALL
jgi:hypothetical protein